MKITKVDLEHFKGIEKASVNFGDLTVITGKNSSGKSSVIQSLKYLTQWLKKIQLTKGLNEFSAPSMEISHPSFIVENKDYESIRNSKSPTSKGIKLGVELQEDTLSNTFNRYGRYSISAEFENITQERNKVRPRSITLSLPKHWNEIRDTFVDEDFDVIYHDVNTSQLLYRKKKYIEEYGNGQIMDRVLNNDRYIAQSNTYTTPFEDQTKKTFLHMLLGYKHESSSPSGAEAKEKFIEALKKIQVDENYASGSDKEKALIINSANERLSFNNSSNLKVIRYSGSKNVFFDLFEDYILDPLKANKITDSNHFEEEDVNKLLSLITKIYHSNPKNRDLLADYLRFDVTSKGEMYDYEYGHASPGSKMPIIKGLNPEFLSEKKIGVRIMKSFQALTDFVNSSKYPEQAVGAVQILLFYVEYLNNLAKSKSALMLSKYMEELTENEKLFSEDLPDSVFENPLNTIGEIQNCLGKSSEFIGIKYTSGAFQDMRASCECLAPVAYHVMSQVDELTRTLNPWDSIQECPDGINIGKHIYTLTAPDEKFEPNEYTLRPKAHLRGDEFQMASFMNQLKKIVEKQSSDSFELYFSILNEDKLKAESSYQKSLTFYKSTEKISQLRERILQLEDLDRVYETNIEGAYEDYAELKSKLQNLSENETKDYDVDKYFDSLQEPEVDSVGNLHLPADELNSEEYEGLEYEEVISDEDINKKLQNLERVGYERLDLEKQIAYLDELRISWDQKRKDISDDKKLLLYELKEIQEKNEIFNQEWNIQLVKNIELLMNTKYVSINPLKDSEYESPYEEIEIDGLSEDLQYLNTGRNPSSGDYPGEFYANLPVGKIGGLLTDLIYEEGETRISPFLFPSVKDSDSWEYFHSRNFNDLDWHTISPKDEQFVTSFNMWISYLSMEVSEVTSQIEGVKPMLKVTGKDGAERDIYEVGSGIGQVLPVIAICLLAKPGEVVCVEEPEAHLHPSAQAYLADFLLAMAASGRQIIVETHSPNIIDRLRLRRVHHKSWKKFKNKEWIKSELQIDDVPNKDKKYRKFKEPSIKIIFAEQNSDGFSTYKEAAIDPKGDIIFGQSQDEIWPDGFFDNAQQELSYILKARISAEEE